MIFETDMGNSSVCKPLEAVGCALREQGKIGHFLSFPGIYCYLGRQSKRLGQNTAKQLCLRALNEDSRAKLIKPLAASAIFSYKFPLRNRFPSIFLTWQCISLEVNRNVLIGTLPYGPFPWRRP